MLILSFVLLPVIGAAGVVALGKNHWKIRNEFFRIMTLVSLAFSAFFLANALNMKEFSSSFEGAVGLGLNFRADGFRSMYAFLASFMWAMTALMSERYFQNYHNRTRYYFFSLMTLAGTLGVFMSDDLYTTFVFFEIMSMASYAWVAHDETEGAMRAAATYLGVAVLGGMVTLMGMFMMYKEIGSLSFTAIHEAKGMNLHLASGLILFGFIAKAGAVPVQIWLPKAHPVAPAPASALLSGMLTKTGLFGVLVIAMNLYSGSYVFGCITLAVALVTMLLGAVLGVFSTNLKRTLACSSMSQIGYILTGVGASVLLGEHGSLPAAGAVMHMVNHSVLKLVLFMSAGVVYMNLHRLELNDIRGFGRKKPFLNIVFLLGALGLMGIPGTSGYASKTLIHEGLVEWVVHTENMFIFRFSEWVFLFAAGLTTAYMLKLYVAIFIQKNPDEKRQADFDNMGKKYLDARTRIALTLSAAWILVLGLLPNGVFMKAYTMSEHFLHQHALHEIHFFSWVNLKGGLITLVIGTLVYFLVVRTWMYKKEEGYVNRWPKWLDLEDMIYRPVLVKFIPFALSSAANVMNGFGEFAAKAFMGVITFAARVMDEFTDHIVVIFKEFALVDREHDHQENPHSGYLRHVRNFFDGMHRFRKRVTPHMKPDPREVTNLEYGSSVTNAVSFGLILATIGIVFAFIYVLLPMISK